MNLTSEIFKDELTDADAQEIAELPGPILIIGASGFIGAKCFFAFLKRRKDVYGTIRGKNRGWRLACLDDDKLSQHLIDCDITDIHELRHKLGVLRPRTIFNFSAYGAYERQSDAQQIHQVNYVGVLNLITVLKEIGCDAFIQAGSSSEYGLNCTAPKESDELVPNSDYAVSKGGAGLLIRYYGKIHSFPCVNLRLYSIFGPFEDRNRLIPNLVGRGLRGEYPVFVDKGISRDFVYVDDCIRAFVKACQICKTEPGSSLNIGSSRQTSMEEVALTAQQVFGITKAPTFGTMKPRKWDLSNWYADASLAHTKLGWKAQISLAEGLRLTANWEKAAAATIHSRPNLGVQKKVTAIIACYRDAQAIPIMYQRLVATFAKLDVDYEIIFVNDGSPANDEEVIREICRRDVHVMGIVHSRNFGSQSAFVSGMELSSGDAVVLLDGDLQDPPELIAEFVPKWLEGYDVVYGIRAKRQAPLFMQLAYKVFYRIFHYLADVQMPLDAGDFSLIDRKVVTKLLALPEKDFLVRGLRAWVGFKQTGVPFERPERMFGTTTNNLLKNIWWAKKAIFAYSIKPLGYMQGVGALIFIASVFLSLFYLAYYFMYPETGAKGVTTIVLLILGLGGIQILSMSILGDYIGKILEEVKNRPRFIRAHVIRGPEVITDPAKIEKIIRR